MSKRKPLKSRVMSKAWNFTKSFKLSFSISLRYAWSYFKNDYSPYFEIEFKKKDNTISKRLGQNLELKAQGLIFYSLTDSKHKTANPKNVISLTAKNLKVKEV